MSVIVVLLRPLGLRLATAMKRIIILIGILAVLLPAANALADSLLSLVKVTVSNSVGPQSDSAPCIIAGTTCQNPATFPYTNFEQKGSLSAYDEVSPNYTVSQFPFLQFNVAIDVNTADHGETLDSFEVWLNGVGTGTLLYHYTGPTNIGTDLANNGNGYADWFLESINLTGLNPNDLVTFHAVWDGASDGAESFFIFSTTVPPIPEPTTLLLLGSGLAGIALVSWRKRKS